MEFVEALMNPCGEVTRELATRVWDEFSSVDLKLAQSIATAFIESEDSSSLASNWLEVVGANYKVEAE